MDVGLPPWGIWGADVSSVGPSSFALRSDEGLALGASAFWIFHCGGSAFVGSFDKTKLLF